MIRGGDLIGVQEDLSFFHTNLVAIFDLTIVSSVHCEIRILDLNLYPRMFTVKREDM